MCPTFGVQFRFSDGLFMPTNGFSDGLCSQTGRLKSLNGRIVRPASCVFRLFYGTMAAFRLEMFHELPHLYRRQRRNPVAERQAAGYRRAQRSQRAGLLPRDLAKPRGGNDRFGCGRARRTDGNRLSCGKRDAAGVQARQNQSGQLGQRRTAPALARYRPLCRRCQFSRPDLGGGAKAVRNRAACRLAAAGKGGIAERGRLKTRHPRFTANPIEAAGKLSLIRHVFIPCRLKGYTR